MLEIQQRSVISLESKKYNRQSCDSFGSCTFELKFMFSRGIQRVLGQVLVTAFMLNLAFSQERVDQGKQTKPCFFIRLVKDVVMSYLYRY